MPFSRIGPKIFERKIIHSFFIPRKVKGTIYWLKRGVYIYRRYERVWFGYYPDRWFSDMWVNKCRVSKSVYNKYKKTGKFPSNIDMRVR